MAEVLELVLKNNAGKISYVHSLNEERFIEKSWRTTLELNGVWARRALKVEFEEVYREFRKRGYEETTCWPPNWKNFSGIYVFAPNEGGLVRGIIQLARDYNVNPEVEEIIPYYDTNLDLKSQQEFLISKVIEYVEIINNLI